VPASSGLGAGGKAGIGIGVAVVVIAALLFIIWRMHQKIRVGVGNNAHERAELPDPSSETGYAKRYTQGSLQPYEHEMKNPNQPELMALVGQNWRATTTCSGTFSSISSASAGILVGEIRSIGGGWEIFAYWQFLRIDHPHLIGVQSELPS